jgi:hypothetical protein
MNEFEYIQIQVKYAQAQVALQNAVLIGEAEEDKSEDKVIKGFGQKEEK